MISELKRFHSAVGSSPELRQGPQSAGSPDELGSVVSYAASQGYTFSAGELEEWGKQKAGSELSDADLDNVAGGGTGGGTGNSWGRQIRLWLVGVDPNF
jgi:predicted ribosomally synthesized peptide with nif11-like leader